LDISKQPWRESESARSMKLWPHICVLYCAELCRYSKCHVTSNKAPHSELNPAHSLWWEEFLNTRSSTHRPLVFHWNYPILAAYWPPFASHILEPTPLSEICLLRIQGYCWPCSKLRDTCYKGVRMGDSYSRNSTERRKRRVVSGIISE
jgi:hypothetical protein